MKTGFLWFTSGLLWLGVWFLMGFSILTIFHITSCSAAEFPLSVPADWVNFFGTEQSLALKIRLQHCLNSPICNYYCSPPARSFKKIKNKPFLLLNSNSETVLDHSCVCMHVCVCLCFKGLNLNYSGKQTGCTGWSFLKTLFSLTQTSEKRIKSERQHTTEELRGC